MTRIVLLPSLLAASLLGCASTGTLLFGTDIPASGVGDDDDNVGTPGDTDGDGTPNADDCAPNDADLNDLDEDGDGVSTCDGDCDDAAASVSPAAPERCNGRDDNCDGVAEAGPSPDFFAKANGTEGFERWVWNGDGFDGPVAHTLPGSGAVYAAVVADVDGDGGLDVVVEQYRNWDDITVYLLRDDCDGGFTTEELGGVDLDDTGADLQAAGDLDNDGDIDLLGWTWEDGRGVVFMNQGDGETWERMIGGQGVQRPFWLEYWDTGDEGWVEGVSMPLVDLDDDNVLDLIECTNPRSAPTECTFHRGDGEGHFEATDPFWVDAQLNGFGFADLDGDGEPGLVGGLDDDGDAGQAWTWNELVEGTERIDAFDVAPQAENSTDEAGYGWLHLYDFSADGTPDVIAAISDPFASDGISIFYGEGDGGGSFDVSRQGGSSHNFGADDFWIPDVLWTPVRP